MKIFIHKSTGEYGHYMGKGEFAFSTIPQVFPDTMDEENFRKYIKSQEGCDLVMEDFDIKNIEIIILD